MLDLGAVVGHEGNGVAGGDGSHLNVGSSREAVGFVTQIIRSKDVRGVLRLVALRGFADVLPLLGRLTIDNELRLEVVSRGDGG